MSTQMLEDAKMVRQALATENICINVSISRETADFMAEILEAKASGKVVLISRSTGNVSPAEAAAILGISRPQVRKIMDSGRLPFHMVGTHHRIAISDLLKFQKTERTRRKDAMRKLMALENELGI